MPTSDLVLATGSVALIYQLMQTFCEPGDEVVYAWRSFEAYPIAATVAAATSVRVPVTGDGRHDLAAMAGRHHRPDAGRAGLHAQQPDRARP